ncbi:MAG: EndoU domain-containing protein [bacterium]
MKNIFTESEKVAVLADEHGFELTAASLDIAAESSSLITAETIISKAVSKVINETNKTKNKFINLASKERTKHILFGEKTKRGRFGGGHKFPGNPTKTVFPKSWSEEKIMHEISDIAIDPNLKWVPVENKVKIFTGINKPERFSVIGVRDNVRIEVILELTGEGIISGYPLNGLGVTCKAKNI